MSRDMQTQVLHASSSNAISQAFAVLQAGGLVAFPTDTVYGVGALVFDGKAIESIYAAKGRPVEKAIPILIGDVEDLDKIAIEVPAAAHKLAERFWPGPLTLLVPKRAALPPAVSATPTVGVRLPDHEVARSLLRAVGPMAVTSANISGAKSPVTVEEVYEQLSGRIPLILDGGRTPGGVPSTLVDCTIPELSILRQGPIALEELLSALA